MFHVSLKFYGLTTRIHNSDNLHFWQFPCIHCQNKKRLFHLIFSKYISEIKIEKWRISLTRFRTNNHKLAIETGRWNKLPINERKCNFCLELEDDFHFLLECKLYITLRKRILPKYYWNRTNIFEIF